ncbi:MAG: relaxase domain-containing protein [Bifidobacteriaceae bacterium]|jgi:conjugative relaxase-like TrwC/TraI family protein|nr:relaxase domain-containing protein [Bifidobacteriaceae bacterium]
MTVSMRLMSAGDGYKYLLKSVAAGDGDRSLSTPLTRYYAESGTPPGRWMGTGLQALQPEVLRAGDTVTEAQLQLLIGDGRNPITGDVLGRPYLAHRTAAERAAARVAASPPGLHDADRAILADRIGREEAAKGTRRTVAAYDFTFSVPKSVSVLWGLADAGLQELIAAAHHQAVAEVLGFMEREVVATRVGASTRGGPSLQVDVGGVLATAFDHYDSRAGDPQLHTHVVVSNKVPTAVDGRWRAIDGRPMFAATVAVSELYNAVLADRLAAAVGVRWETRERGRDRSPAWEIAGVGEDLVREFSSRSGDIDAETARLISEHTERHGRSPSRRTVIRYRQQATLATRQDKVIRSLADLTAEWAGRARPVLGTDPLAWARRVTDPEAAPVLLRADDVPLDLVAEVGASVVAVVGERRSTWRRWNLHAEASRQLMGWRFATLQDREAVSRLVVDAAEAASVRLTPPELSVPDGFARVDGSRRFRPRHMDLYSSQDLLDAEAALLAWSRDLGGPAARFAAVERAVSRPDPAGRTLGDDQAQAIAAAATSGRVVDVLVGPAGAGKTTALAALRRAWEETHGAGSVVGLAPSATAAAVLAEDLGIPTENTAKWLTDHRLKGTTFRAGQLAIVDEASLAGTFTLEQIARQAAGAGAKLLLVGDWAQLQAVDAGGAFNLLVTERSDPPELADVRRFHADWERPASLALRHANPAAIDAYHAHGRIAGGDQDGMVEAAYQAWRTDLEAGRASLLVADSLETVRALNQRARSERIIAGQVNPGREAALADGCHASRGDLVITRRNHRRLQAGNTGWVRNGDRWTVLKVHPGGGVTARRAGMSTGGTVTLPAAYTAEHLDLGYAVTSHRAQGVTVDTAHVVVTPATTRENLYVAMTRGRDSNRAYVATDRPDQDHTVPHPADPDEPTPRSVLAGVLRNSGAELSAHQTIRAEAEAWGNTTQLGAEWETLAQASLHDRWAALVRSSLHDPAQADRVVASEAFGALAAELHRALAAGWDPEAEFPRLAAARPLDDAADPAAVLHARLATVLDQAEVRPNQPRRRAVYLLGMFPEAPVPASPAMAQALAERRTALQARAAEVLARAQAAGEPWLAALGPRPADPAAAERWTAAALATAAYRDRYQVDGPEPWGRPDGIVQRRDAQRIRALANQAPRPAPPTPAAAQAPATPGPGSPAL